MYVEDENDNAPVFEHSVYEGTIKENCISGTEVEMNYPIKATDADSSVNAAFTFTLFGDGSEMFRIDKHSGKVYFTSADSPLDREQKAEYILRLVAADKGGLKSEVRLNITVLDENDNAPMFVQMNIVPNQGVQILEQDGGRLGVIIVSEDTNMTDTVFLRKGNKRVMSPLLGLPEHIPVGTPILRLFADDRDAGPNAVIKYEMVSETYIPGIVSSGVGLHVTQYFMVHPTSGEISVARQLLAESEFRLNISAIDSGDLRDNLTIKIFVRDYNDHAPVFEKSFYNFDAVEGYYTDHMLGKIEASDADFGQNANITYTLLAQMENELLPFSIGDYSGVLRVNGDLDRETRDKYKFKVVARDNAARGSAQLSSTVDVEVNVLDVNDNAPEFYGYDELISVPPPEAELFTNHNFEATQLIPVYYATVAENSPIGTPITRVFANDSDFTGNGNGLLLFDVQQRRSGENLFAVDSKDGVITTVGKLDYEMEKTHNVTVVASDLGSPSLSSTAMLMVTVIDVPDDTSYAEVPVFAHRYYEVELEENVPLPVKLLTLNVTEQYQSHRLRYTLVLSDDKEIASMFKVEPRNGTVYVIQTPDRERRDKYEFKIRLDRVKLGRGMPVMVYPITSERLTGLGNAFIISPGYLRKIIYIYRFAICRTVHWLHEFIT